MFASNEPFGFKPKPLNSLPAFIARDCLPGLEMDDEESMAGFKDEAGLSDDENRPLGRKRKPGNSVW